MALAATILSSCALVYKPAMQQGNILVPAEVKQLRSGMTKSQVEDLLGSPVDVQVFRKNKVTYVYFLIPQHGSNVNKHLIINFRNGKVFNWVSKGL